MVNIENIMTKLDWNLPKEVQEQGISLSNQTKELWYFIQPCTTIYNKNVWDGCATILSLKTDDELEPYLVPLLEWLKDANWPGFDTVLNRLIIFEARRIINQYSYCIIKAIEQSDEAWLTWLSLMIKNKELFCLLKDEYKKIMKKYYDECEW